MYKVIQKIRRLSTLRPAFPGIPGQAFAIFILQLLLLACSCEKSTTDPPPPVTKPDTTSHNFVWQIDALGKLTSKLSDVFAISENDIWAVGEIDIENSSDNEETFNAAYWDGLEWKLKKISVDYLGNEIVVPLRGIFSFSSSDIWVSGGLPIHGDGEIWQLYHLFDMGVLNVDDGNVANIWGSSSNNLYLAGIRGTIVHHSANNWQNLESGTNIDLLDIYGNSNGSAIWTCGYTSNFSESILLHYDGTQWQTVWQWNFQQGSSDSTYEGLLQSLWVIDFDSLMVVGGEGVYRQDIQGNSPPRKENLTLGAFPNCVRGSAPNNIFIVGFNGMVWHYNGATWKTYPELRNPNWVFRSVAVLENKMVAVGLDYSQGIQRDIILTGVRPKY